MEATSTFSASALGLMTAGAKLSSDITAMYPEAPACPTDEYNTATRNTPMSRISKVAVGRPNEKSKGIVVV